MWCALATHRRVHFAAQQIHHPADRARRAAALVEYPPVRRRRLGQQRRRALARIGRKQLRRPADAGEMRQVKLRRVRLAPEHAGQRRAVVLGQFGGHQRRCLGIEAQRHDLGAHGRIAHPPARYRRFRPAESVLGAVALKRIKPGAAGELIEPGRARGFGARRGVEAGFDPRLGQQIIEIGAGSLRRPRDRGVDACSRDGCYFAQAELPAQLLPGAVQQAPCQLTKNRDCPYF